VTKITADEKVVADTIFEIEIIIINTEAVKVTAAVARNGARIQATVIGTMADGKGMPDTTSGTENAEKETKVMT